MKKWKKILLILLIIAVVVAGVVFGLHKLKEKNQNSRSAGVYPVNEIAYDASMMWDSSTLSGTVTVNSEQKVFVAAEQQVAEVKVHEGQTVKAGDVLMVYDITSQNLQMELQKTELELSRVNVIKAQRELEQLKATKPREDYPPEAFTATPTDLTEPTEADMAPTRDELNVQIQDKENQIRSMQIQYELDQVALKMQELQNPNGEVYANFDGIVKTVTTADAAAASGEPMMVISAADGYLVETQVGELALGSLKIGDKVSMYCYDTGMEYEGMVAEISTMPAEDGESFSYGSTVESYYPVKISVTDSENISQNMYMEITLLSGEEETEEGFYLSKAFMIQEGANYYVMKDDNGVLKKCYVKVGKKQSGDAILVTGGLSMDDFIAFPYLDEAVEGVKTVQKEIDDLYGY